MEIRARTYVVQGANQDVAKRAAERIGGASLVQSVRLDSAANGFFIEMIAAQTLHAKATGNLLAKKPEIDFLLRLAGTTQIKEAIESVGVQDGRPFLLVVAGAGPKFGHLRGKPGRWKELAKRALTEGELDRIEHAALLNALRA